MSIIRKRREFHNNFSLITNYLTNFFSYGYWLRRRQYPGMPNVVLVAWVAGSKIKCLQAQTCLEIWSLCLKIWHPVLDESNKHWLLRLLNYISWNLWCTVIINTLEGRFLHQNCWDIFLFPHGCIVALTKVYIAAWFSYVFWLGLRESWCKMFR